jgi:hypothetical protein
MVARDLLHGDARTYGILLGCFGMGAIGIAPTIPHIRRNASPERIVMASSMTHGSAILVIAVSPFQFLSMAALAVAGASWLIIMSTYNLGIQMAAPRWVTGRAVAAFQATVSGSLALGAAIWGQLSNLSSIISSLEVAGILLLLTPIIGRFLPLPAIEQDDLQSVPARGKPDTRLNMTGRRGPLTVEVEYCIEVEHARSFYHLALQVQRMRGRNGAYGAAVARDVSQPTRWVERFHYPTWDDYRRARERPTRAERDLNQSLLDMQSAGQPLIVRRLLERPFGSVRWRDSSRDDQIAPPPTDGPI